MSSFRSDVEGLRAVAIVTVLLSHAGVAAAAGGYVGVDVFFVISGFVITRMLLGELDRTGRISLAGFYARRVKRLMPQALAVMVAVAVAAPLLLSPLRADPVAGDVMAAGAYAMNWRLSADVVDYFATGEDRPLDHFWSLAVEEQFYVLWPLALLALAWRARGRHRRRVLPAMVVIAAASFAHATQLVADSPDQAYFSAPARAWELALGGIVAALGRDRVPGAPVLACLGAGAIAVAVVTFGPDTPVPGPAALLPTLGAAALLVSPTRLLASRPARYVGRISYAWYIWHWPVIVFARPGTAAAGLLVTLASAVPAVATHRWIEEPMRRSKIHLRRPRATLAAALACPALAFGCGVALSASLPTVRDIRPSPREAAQDRGASAACLVDRKAKTSPACVYGDRRARTTVVLFGDSHAMQWFPALERVARRKHWRLVQLTKSGCPPSPVRVIYVPTDRELRECAPWREHALRRIAAERPKLVVVSASAHYTVLEGGRRLDRDEGAERLAAGYAATLRRLRGRVAVIADPPRPPFDVPDCVSQERRCTFPLGPAVARARVVAEGARRAPGVAVIDPAGRFCDGELCSSVIENVLVYRNSGHVTASFAATLAGWLGRELSRPAASPSPAATSGR